jgi:magnesium-transporting ATPase (P-type)
MVLTTIVYFVYLGIVGQYTNSRDLFRLYLDLLVTAIPPTLPTILNVGIKFVQSRLKSQGINSIIPKSVLTGGKVDTIVLKGEQVFGK